MRYTIRDALDEMPKPPCERFGGCEHYDTCRDQQLACEQFWVYVTKSGTRGRIPPKEPVKKYYDRIFNEEGDDL